MDISWLIEDPDFAQIFTVHRRTGKWVEGAFELDPTRAITMVGVVQPAGAQDMEQLPEGDRVKGMMKFYSRQELYRSRVDGDGESAGVSDEVEWRGKRFKIISVIPWPDQGFYVAFGT
jgi:hypothetical protein